MPAGPPSSSALATTLALTRTETTAGFTRSTTSAKDGSWVCCTPESWIGCATAAPWLLRTVSARPAIRPMLSVAAPATIAPRFRIERAGVGERSVASEVSLCCVMVLTSMREAGPSLLREEDHGGRRLTRISPDDDSFVRLAELAGETRLTLGLARCSLRQMRAKRAG